MKLDPLLQMAPVLKPESELTHKGDADAAKAFDELFARIMLSEVSKTLGKNGLFGGQQAQAFESVWTDALASKIAEAGPGLGAVWLERSGAGVGGTGSEFAPTALKSRSRPHKHDPITPTRPSAMRVSSAYGVRTDPITGHQRAHHGVDLAAPTGTPIPAVRPGTVSFAGDRGGYGNLVIIDHGNGMETRYAHCHTLEVQAGDYVEAGQQIATVGSTGRSTGPHLHLELRQDGVATDPQKLIAEISKHLENGSDADDE